MVPQRVAPQVATHTAPASRLRRLSRFRLRLGRRRLRPGRRRRRRRHPTRRRQRPRLRLLPRIFLLRRHLLLRRPARRRRRFAASASTSPAEAAHYANRASTKACLPTPALSAHPARPETSLTAWARRTASRAASQRARPRSRLATRSPGALRPSHTMPRTRLCVCRTPLASPGSSAQPLRAAATLILPVSPLPMTPPSSLNDPPPSLSMTPLLPCSVLSRFAAQICAPARADDPCDKPEYCRRMRRRATTRLTTAGLWCGAARHRVRPTRRTASSAGRTGRRRTTCPLRPVCTCGCRMGAGRGWAREVRLVAACPSPLVSVTS